MIGYVYYLRNSFNRVAKSDGYVGSSIDYQDYLDYAWYRTRTQGES